LEDKVDRGGQIAVVGGGPAGLACALLMAGAGASIDLFAPAAAGRDSRTSALMRGSVEILRAIGVWDELKPRAAPLQRLRLVDATGRLVRAPEVTFDAAELGRGPFGYNIHNVDLTDAMTRRLAAFPTLRAHAQAVSAVAPLADRVRLTSGDGGRFEAALVAAADGRDSQCREAAGISCLRHDYPQVALAFNVCHALPHDDVSTEFHTPSGPLTFVPLPGNISSVVWVVRPEEADRLLALEDDAFCEDLRRRCYGLLGGFSSPGKRHGFALSLRTAWRMAQRRIALVGEAGHVVPPIGAQGLNLGLRDGATLAEIAVDALRAGKDPGSEECQAAYAQARRADIAGRSAAIDLLNRSVLSPFLPAQAMRGAGLFLLSRLAPLRHAAMRAGLAAPVLEPRVMRGEPL